MHQEGHVGLSLLLYAPIAYWLVAHDEMLLMGYTMIGVIAMAPFPDIDMTLPIKHRGPTHSVWFAVLMGIVYAAFLVFTGTGELTTLQLAAVGFGSGFIGVMGHMLGDVITPADVRPFDPFISRKYRFILTTAGDKRANRILMQAGVYAFGAAIILGAVDLSTFIDPFAQLVE